MIQARTFAYLAPATVLYLTVGVAASGRVDAAGHVIAALAALASSAALQRAPGAGAGRVAWLGWLGGVAAVRLVRPEGLDLGIQLLGATAVAAWAAVLSDLALTVPDRPAALARYRGIRPLLYLLALASALLAALSLGPPLVWRGELWLVPARFARLPLAYAAAALVWSLLWRLSRRRLGSTPQALASNAWALIGLIPGTLVAMFLAGALLAGWLRWSSPWVRGLEAGAMLAVVAGHVMLADRRRRLRAGRAVRAALASVITLLAISAGVGLLRAHLPTQLASLALATAATLLVAYGLYRGLEPLMRRLLAPFGARLLDGVATALERLADVRDLQSLGQSVLVPLRWASGAVDAQPVLYLINPSRACRIDMAGQCHVEPRAMPAALLQHLLDHAREIVLRAPLEAQVVRRPAIRALVDSLVEQDALCVVPLAQDEELEGALVLPRGRRRSALTLEELAALERFGQRLTGVCALLSSEARAQERARRAQAAVERSDTRVERLEDDNARLRADLHVLKTRRDAHTPAAPLVAYSDVMRQLCERLKRTAAQDAPVLLIVETGDAVEAIARMVHQESGRTRDAFVVADCAAVTPENGAGALFGDPDGEPRWPGWLRLADEGTLLLLDVPALPASVQHDLAEALATRQARRADGTAPYPVRARVVATARCSLDALVAQGSLDPDLARWLTPLAMQVPPLRERADDMPSLVLLAIDRACRTLGREPVGIAPDAQARLLEHPWHGNVAELQWVIDRAVASCDGSRLEPHHVEPLLSSSKDLRRSEPHPLDGPYDVVERRLLAYALDRAMGNKSEAARLLGLKRTTFLDKVRRHGLEEGSSESDVPLAERA